MAVCEGCLWPKQWFKQRAGKTVSASAPLYGDKQYRCYFLLRFPFSGGLVAGNWAT